MHVGPGGEEGVDGVRLPLVDRVQERLPVITARVGRVDVVSRDGECSNRPHVADARRAPAA